jgi:monoamine oxidase
MYNSLKMTKTLLGYSVKAISETNTGMDVSVSINGQPPVVMSYAAVISTTSLSCLSVMDLTGCNIAGGDNYSQWAAIRELQYGPAIKIGLKFTAPWWETLTTGSIVGGQSYTDLPIRTTSVPLLVCFCRIS